MYELYSNAKGANLINQIKVLVVDDSALVRKMLKIELDKDNSISVVGTAPDPYIARDKIVQLNPDVILLDVEMPRMDGLTFLQKLMKHYPSRVIIVSSLAKKNSDVAIKAMEYGALDVVAKPGVAYSVQDMADVLIQKIKHVALVPKHKLGAAKKPEKKVQITHNMSAVRTTNKIIAIGASTGGTEAIRTVLEKLPPNMPPIIVVQHMPEFFTQSFAERLNDICALEVKEAQHMDILSTGKVLIAPGNVHLTLKRSGALYYARLSDGPKVCHQRPSVEVMFNSVAQYAGKNAIGVILTGMGKDGAEGMLHMKEAGAYTIAQDEKSSIVFGMPKEAIALGGVCKVVTLELIADEIRRALK